MNPSESSFPQDSTSKISLFLGDRRAAIVGFIEQLDAPTAASTIDLRGSAYLGTFSATLLLAKWLDAQRAKLPVRVILPVGGRRAREFHHFSGLDHWLLGSPPPVEDHPQNVTVPLRQVTQSNFGLVTPVTRLIRRHTTLSEDGETYLGNCIYESVQNVEDHARSPIGAVICARYVQKTRSIRVAIVDRGQGIPTTLRGRYPDVTDDDHALLRVIQGGMSAQSRPHNRGLGLLNLWQQVVNALHGDIFIVSERAVVYSDSSGKPVSRLVASRFGGTGVFFTVPIDGRT